MYQIPQVIPTQTYIPQTQVSTIPQNFAPQMMVPRVSQIPIANQVQSITPIQNVTNFVQTPAPQTVVVPYVLPIGSRFPLPQHHQGILPINMNFNNIGGSIYGRVSIIK